LTMASDEELMAGFRSSGSEDTFEELFRRHGAAAYRTVLSILGDTGAAEDVLQESLLRMVRARRSYRPGMPFCPWFYTIIRNVCRDEIRRPRRATVADCTAAEDPRDCEPCAALERLEEVRLARRAFARLPDLEREALALRIYGELSFAEIAQVSGISTEAAKKRAYRGLARLRRALAQTE